MMEERMERGMETAMIRVERHDPEEQKDHEAGERGGDDAFSNDSVDGGADEDGLVTDGGDFELLGDGGFDCRQPVQYAFDDAQGGG